VYQSLSRLQAVILAVVVLAGLALGGMGLFSVGSRHWPGSDSFAVSVSFQDVGGVDVGTRVRIQGLDAGEVEGVQVPVSAGSPVHLNLRLAGRFRELIGDPATAQVQIGSDSLWGGKFVKIIPGRPRTGPLQEPVVLQSQAQPELTQELAQAAGQARQVLGEIDNTMKGVRKGEGTLGQLVKNDKLYTEMTGTADRAKAALEEVSETFDELKSVLKDIRNGKGTLGQLVKNQEAYTEALRTVAHVRELATSVKQNSDAIKTMPIIRSYVVDPHKLLNRPDCTFIRKVLPASKLFRPGRAVLTDAGRENLAEVAAWLNENKESDSEVVVAAYAPRSQDFEAAQTLTQKQSEVVCNYLTSNYKVHKTGWWFWKKRPVKPVGCATMASPIPGDAKKKMPAARVEVLVFSPQS
jgi:phospholipid/cholesterol/gamma-HCH transport system substrate-binding protein